MNYKKIFDTLVEHTRNYLNSFGLKTMVLGISGGIDSTITAAICSEVVKRYHDDNFKFVGVSLPCSTNSEEENHAAQLTMDAFCQYSWTCNLEEIYLHMKNICEEHINSSTLSLGNIKARLRMIYLYNLASRMNGLVMDTDNLTEHYLGFFTIHGDVADYNPIGGLWKHEVYELCKFIKEQYANDIDPNGENQLKVEALDHAYNIMPTDGNGVLAGGDLAQIAPGYTYNDVDKVLKWIVEDFHELNPPLEAIKEFSQKTGFTEEMINGIIKRHSNSSYKRGRLPVTIPRSHLIYLI